MTRIPQPTGEPILAVPDLLRRLRAGGELWILQAPHSGEFIAARLLLREQVFSVSLAVTGVAYRAGRLECLREETDSAGQRRAFYGLRSSRSSPGPSRRLD